MTATASPTSGWNAGPSRCSGLTSGVSAPAVKPAGSRMTIAGMCRRRASTSAPTASSTMTLTPNSIWCAVTADLPGRARPYKARSHKARGRWGRSSRMLGRRVRLGRVLVSPGASACGGGLPGLRPGAPHHDRRWLFEFFEPPLNRGQERRAADRKAGQADDGAGSDERPAYDDLLGVQRERRGLLVRHGASLPRLNRSRGSRCPASSRTGEVRVGPACELDDMAEDHGVILPTYSGNPGGGGLAP